MKRELFRTTGESDAPQLPHLFARFRDRRAQSPREHSLLRARPRVLPRCDSRLGVAADDASDRLLHSETTETRVPVTSSLPGAAVTRVRPFGDTRGCSRSEACASCSLARRRAACHPSARRRRSGHREARGRSMQVRPGKTAFHDATLTSVTVRCDPCGVDSSARPTDRPPLTSLSPPPCARLSNRWCDRCENPKAAKIGSAGAS